MYVLHISFIFYQKLPVKYCTLLNHRCWLELDEVCEVDLLAELGHHLHVGADLPHELLPALAADHLAQLQRGPQGKPHPLLVHLHTVLWNTY